MTTETKEITINAYGCQRLAAAIFGKDLTPQDISPEVAEPIFHALDKLTPIERPIIVLRYGLISVCPYGYSLREVGRGFGVCGERIRQIQSHAIRRLRNHAISAPLRKFVINNKGNNHHEVD